jgi:membrane protein DedA with SNARE-associated domain
VSNELDAVSYYTVGFLRLLVSDPLFFLLGFWYGEAALSWMDRKTGRTGEYLRKAEQAFGKAAYVLVFVAPNNYICLFAGASRMPVPAFVAVNAAGTIARLYLIRRVGEAFESPIEVVLDFLRSYQLPLTVATIALVAIQIAADRRRGTSELESIGRLEHEIEEEIERVEQGEHRGEPGEGRPDVGDDPAPPPQP